MPVKRGKWRKVFVKWAFGGRAVLVIQYNLKNKAGTVIKFNESELVLRLQ